MMTKNAVKPCAAWISCTPVHVRTAKQGAGTPDTCGAVDHIAGGGKRRTAFRMASNPRYANGSLRRKYRARFKAMQCECGICHGKLGPIHYDEPSDPQHPLSFVIDEIKPVSKWKQFGYPSVRAAAEDWNNLQPAHYWCNAQKRDKVGSGVRIRIIKKKKIEQDGSW